MDDLLARLADVEPPQAHPTKRETVFEALEKMNQLNEAELEEGGYLADWDEALILEQKMIGFRWHAPSTQNKQDRILAGYLEYVKRAYKNTNPDPDDDELWVLAFPTQSVDGNEEWSILLQQLRHFLTFVIMRMTPRSLTSPTVSYGILVEYRRIILFWLSRFFTLTRQEPPPTNLVKNSLTEAMRFMAVNMGINQNQPTAKTFLGLPEIIQLIDMDMRGTVNIMLAKAHHFAWLLCRFCALRPGSIGIAAQGSIPDVQLPFLTFGDFEVTRASGGTATKGMFNISVTIRNLKGKPDQNAEKQGFHSKSVKFHIRSPQKQYNLALSLPHRFLVLALRRGALQDYRTIRELLNDDRRHIRIKEEFSANPIVPKGTHRGLDIELDKPATAQALTEYLRLRGKRIGYPNTVSFYSIRRKAATDFAKAIGADGAREILTHEPDTRTLELYYLELRSTTNVTALGLGEEESAETAVDMNLDAHTLALDRLNPEYIAACSGALEALLRRTLLKDKVWKECTSAKQQKNRERVLRKSCLNSLLEAAHKERAATETSADRHLRKEEFLRKSSDFNQRLLERALEIANDPDLVAKIPDPDEILATSSKVDVASDFKDDIEKYMEPDIEDQLEENQDQVEVLEENAYSEEFVDYMSLLENVPYPDGVRSAMELLWESGPEDGQRPGEPRQCPLCLDDDTMTEEDGKYKLHPAKNFTRHLHTQQHSEFSKLLRKWRNLRRERQEEDQIVCEFCRALRPEKEKMQYFKQEKDLRKHLKNSNATKIWHCRWGKAKLAAEHEQAKVAAGWNDADFFGDEAAIEQKQHHRKLREERRLSNIVRDPVWVFTEEGPLPGPIDDEDTFGLVSGYFGPHPGPHQFSHLMQLDTPSNIEAALSASGVHDDKFIQQAFPE